MLEPVNPLAAFIKGPGLIATVNGGIVFANSVNNTIVQTSVVLTANATNYLYLQISSPVSLQVNTSGFPTSNCYPIAIIVTGNNNIVTLIDSRPDAYLNDGGTISPANVTVTNQLLIPISAGFTSSVDGSIGYDSTNKSTHVRTNSADSLVAAFASTPAGGKCLQSSGVTGLVSETGSACGSGSGTNIGTFYNGQASGSNFGTTNTNTSGFGVWFTYPISAANIWVDVTTADNTGGHTIQFLIYNSTGTQVATTAATVLGSGGFVKIAFSGGTTTFPAGKYYVALTGTAANTATIIEGSSNFVAFPFATLNASGAAASITPPSDNYGFDSAGTFKGFWFGLTP